MINFLRSQGQPLARLVVGINQVDKIIHNGWDERLNMPTERAEREIQRRSTDTIRKLARYANIASANMEYYSALKRYRLWPLLVKIIRNAYAGFKLDDVEPADPFEHAAPDVRAYAEEERKKRMSRKNRSESALKDRLLEEMGKLLSQDELDQLKSKLVEERSRPPRMAVFGKTGVGKTTTINNLFNAQWKTSHTLVGTTEAQLKEFVLPAGSTLMVLDLPGYGRTIAEDREYEKIYREVIPTCDLVLLILQANSRDFRDDQEMILKVAHWLKQTPIPRR